MRKSLLSVGVLVLLVSAVAPAFAGTGEAPLLGVGAWFGAMIAFGLVVNESTLSGLYKSFLTIFNQAVSAYQPKWPSIAMRVPSNTSVETYAWMGAFPKMREWIGERNWKNLETFAMSITNKDYESTVGVKRSTIEDDQYGVFSPIIASQGAAAAALWDDLVFDLLNNGFAASSKSYDGKVFFATDHASGSNKDSGAGSALSSTSYANAIKLIKSQKDSEGKPLFNGSERLTLVVGPALEQTARLLLNADFISVASGSTQNNVWKGSAELIVSPKITSATAWFILVDFMGLKPLIAQIRKEPEFVQMTDPQTSDHVFKKNEFLYGTYARGNAGYGLHQLAFGSVGA